MATTSEALARAFTPPIEGSVQMAEGWINDGKTLVVYCELQPAIGGMVRGGVEFDGKPDEETMLTLRKQAYADLLVNAKRYRLQHGSTK